MGNKLRKLVYELGKNIPPVPAKVFDLIKDIHWDDNSLAELHREIQLEKIVLLAYHNARLLNQQQETSVLQRLMDIMQEEYEKRTSFTESVVPLVRAKATHILQQAGVNFLFIKGSSLDSYPHGYPRQMNDLDLIVENWDDLLAAAEALEAQGFYHLEVPDTPWISRLSPSEEWTTQMVGQINLTCREGEHLVALDTHTSPFTIGSTGMLESEMWERARAQRSTIPTPEDKLLILVAHAANHGYFIIKDFNDVYAILERHKDAFDWDYFCHYVRQSTLSYAAYYVLKHVKQEYAPECVPEQVLYDLRQSKETICAIAIKITSQNSKKWRQWVERVTPVLHTLIFEKQRHGLASALSKSIAHFWNLLRLTVLQGSGWVGKIGEHSVVQRLLHTNKNLLFPSPTRGQQLMILPAAEVCDNVSQEQLVAYLKIAPAALQEIIASKQNGALEVKHVGHFTAFLRMGSAEAILTPIDLFIPTSDGVFADSEVAALEKLTQTLLDACARI